MSSSIALRAPALAGRLLLLSFLLLPACRRSGREITPNEAHPPESPGSVQIDTGTPLIPSGGIGAPDTLPTGAGR